MINPAWLTRLATVATLACVIPSPAAAQDGSTIGGAAAGMAAGAWVGLGYIVIRARAGHYIETPGDAALQVGIPILGGLSTGLAIGSKEEDRLDDTVWWAAAGWAAGAGIGAMVGAHVWDDPPGVWAGAMIGGAVGLIAGGTAGFLTSDSESSGLPVMIRIPL